MFCVWLCLYMCCLYGLLRRVYRGCVCVVLCVFVKMNLCWNVLLRWLLSLSQIYCFNLFWFFVPKSCICSGLLSLNLPVGHKNILLYFTLYSFFLWWPMLTKKIIYLGFEGQQTVRSFVSVALLCLWRKVCRHEPGPLKTLGLLWVDELVFSKDWSLFQSHHLSGWAVPC